MSTSYFVLSKRKTKNISNNDENQIMVFEPRDIHLLPRTNLEYYITNGLFENTLIEWCKQFCSQET